MWYILVCCPTSIDHEAKKEMRPRKEYHCGIAVRILDSPTETLFLRSVMKHVSNYL